MLNPWYVLHVGVDFTIIAFLGVFKNTYKLLNLKALKLSHQNEISIFQCMGKIFCVEFQSVPLIFHTKCLSNTLKDPIMRQCDNHERICLGYTRQPFVCIHILLTEAQTELAAFERLNFGTAVINLVHFNG